MLAGPGCIDTYSALYDEYTAMEVAEEQVVHADDGCTATTSTTEYFTYKPPLNENAILTVYEGEDCTGNTRTITASDFEGGRYLNGFDACNDYYDNGLPMAYHVSESGHHTWWGSLLVHEGTVQTSGSCNDDFDYNGWVHVQTGITAQNGCVTPQYDFNYVEWDGIEHKDTSVDYFMTSYYFADVIAQQQVVLCAASEGEYCSCIGKVYYGQRYMQSGMVTSLNEMRQIAPYRSQTGVNGGVQCDHTTFRAYYDESEPKHCYCEVATTFY